MKAQLLPATLALSLALACAVTGPAPLSAQTIDGTRRAQDALRAQGQGNLSQALTIYGEALQDNALSNDRRAVILSDRGALLARLNQPKGAIDDFNRAVQLYPEYPAIYNNRGSTLLTLGLPQEAIKDFDRAILLAPGYVAAYNNRAGARMLLKQHTEAIADFTKAIELSPNSVAPLNGRGRAYLAADRPQAAMRDFSRALQADARFALGYRNRAQARLSVERYSDAVEDLSRAIVFEAANAQIYIERGLAYMAAGNVAAAIKDYTKALEIAPRSVPALEARALAHVRAEAADEAEADIIRALDIEPRSANAFAARAVLYLRTGQIELAQKEIDKAAKIDSDRPEVLWAKGEVEEALGRREDAVASYRAALAGRPTLKDAADGLSRLGAPADTTELVELRGLGVDRWQVVRRGTRVQAMNPDHARVVVPLEMAGEGLPRLLEWDVKKAPYKDIALLRYSAGQVPAAAGDPTQEAEYIAIIDLPGASVLGVVPHRLGAKRATWTWDEGKVTVASIDGITEEFTLKPGRSRDTSGAAAAVASAAQAPKRTSDKSDRPSGEGTKDSPKTYAPPSWLPSDGNQGKEQRRETKAVQRPAPKPKTLFDILLGN